MEKNTLTFERKHVEGTPFTKQWSESRGWSGGIGDMRITEWYETEKELEKKLTGIKNRGIDWDLMCGVIQILIQKINELDNLTTEKNEN